MAQTTLVDVLRGTQAGSIQSVGLMQVIPLTSQISDDRFGLPGQAVVSTSGYGTLVMRNLADQPLIIPKDTAYVVKQAAQDHALPHVGLIGPGAKATFPTAACIEQTQGGYIKADQYSLIILPFQLREAAFASRQQEGYNKLWPTIRGLNQRMGLGSNPAHVSIYLRAFSQQLAQFVAEFEPVPGQVGAIILLNGRVVGVERTPSWGYWLDIWPSLIRECYGSLALQAAREQMPVDPGPTRQALGSFETVAALQAGLQTTEQQEAEATRAVVRELSLEPLEVEPDGVLAGLTVDTLQSQHFIGQTVRAEGQVVYASLTATAARLTMPRAATAPFSI